MHWVSSRSNGWPAGTGPAASSWCTTARSSAGNADWTEAHFGFFARAALDDTIPSDALESAARAHFGLPADSPVTEC